MIDLKRILAMGGTLVAAAFLVGQAVAADMSVDGPNITGRWFRYPSFHDKPDPSLVPPKPTELMLKPAYKADYEKMRAEQRASDARGYSFVARIVRDCIAREMLTEGQRRRVLEAAES